MIAALTITMIKALKLMCNSGKPTKTSTQQCGTNQTTKHSDVCEKIFRPCQLDFNSDKATINVHE